jgi:hypothetical protein
MTTAEKLTALSDRLAKLDAAYEREMHKIFETEIETIRLDTDANGKQIDDVVRATERYRDGVGVASAMLGAMADYIYS